MSVRLQKAIADAGITSRRKAETLIESGRVFLNDKKANLIKNHNVLITIVDYLESDTLSGQSIFSSDLYVLIGKAGSFTEKQTIRLKKSLDKKLNDFAPM